MNRKFITGLLATFLLCSCTFESTNSNTQIINTASGDLTTDSNTVEEIDIMSSLAPLTKAILSGSDVFRYYESGIIEYGKVDAKNLLVLVTEYHCPYCKEFQQDHMAMLQKNFLSKDDLRLIVIPKPLEKYPNSIDAIKGMMCAGKQSAAKEMHQILFTRTNKHRSSILEYAEEIGINKDELSNCMESDEINQRIDRLGQTLAGLDISFVPTFLLKNKKQVGLPLVADLRGWIEQNIN